MVKPAAVPDGTPRTGSALVRATFPYSEEDVGRTWRELAITLVILFSAQALAVAGPMLLRPVGTVIAALTIVRLFIIYHDALHGAVFRKSRVGYWIMSAVGMFTLNPRSIWRETHDYHHRNNCKLPGTAIGSYPVVTTRMWRRMTPAEKRKYTVARHPVTILFGYIFLFLLGMCMAAFVRNPKEHWTGAVAPVLHFALAALVGWTFGWTAAFTGVILPQFIASALGGYLFYAQHNYPDVQYAPRAAWTYHDAALVSSSYFRMSPVMHFFTGNIGYHHIHHLNHKIPFYRLPECMAAIPELQSPGETSWAPADVWAALRLKLWDPTQKKMVPFPR
ncbi:MAG: fatty acid desaturase [Alphaproteobacteria bacterium]|nr:fatty acid desaturase [Alphaproteobacteria bacterium]MCB9695132.1 fatty acid desaturase [Alphaproteobacteria bacterium]